MKSCLNSAYDVFRNESLVNAFTLKIDNIFWLIIKVIDPSLSSSHIEYLNLILLPGEYTGNYLTTIGRKKYCTSPGTMVPVMLYSPKLPYSA